MGGFESVKLPPAGRRRSDGAASTDLLDLAPRRKARRPLSPTAKRRGSGDVSASAGAADTLLDGLSGGGLKLSAPVGPGARNRPDDVFRLETVLAGADLLGREPGRVFDEGTERAVRTAQGRLNRDHAAHVGRRPLKLDGLVNPDGPTQAATRRLAESVLAERRRKPLPGVKTTEQRFTERRRAVLDRLSADAFAANRRSVDHLMTTTDDGLFPKLLADDFRAGDAGRAHAADLLVQLAVRDPARAGSLRRRAVTAMSADERDLLDGLVADLKALRAREGGAKPKPPGDHHPDPKEPGEPTDPDDGNDEQGKQKKCRQLAVDLANAEQAAKEAKTEAEEADKEFEKWREESGRITKSLDNALAQLAIEVAIPAFGAIRNLRRLLEARSVDSLTIVQLLRLNERLGESREKAEEALALRTLRETTVEERKAKAARINREIDRLECSD